MARHSGICRGKEVDEAYLVRHRVGGGHGSQDDGDKAGELHVDDEVGLYEETPDG